MKGTVTLWTPDGCISQHNQVLYNGYTALYSILSGVNPNNKIYLLKLGISTVTANPTQTDLISPLPYQYLVTSRQYDYTGVIFGFTLTGFPSNLKFSEAAIYANYYDVSFSANITVAVARVVFAQVTLNNAYTYRIDWKFNLV